MFLKILKSIAKVHSLHSHIHSTTWQLARLKNLYSKKSTHLSFWCLLIQIKKTKDSKFRSYLALLLWCNGSNALAKIGNLVKLLLLFNSIFQHSSKGWSVYLLCCTYSFPVLQNDHKLVYFYCSYSGPEIGYFPICTGLCQIVAFPIGLAHMLLNDITLGWKKPQSLGSHSN